MNDAQTLARFGEAVRADPSAGALRAKFPDIHFTECSADDVNPRFQPVLDTGSHELYLISGSTGHCLAITADPEAATGIIVACKSDD